jgi:hypothetical protein
MNEEVNGAPAVEEGREARARGRDSHGLLLLSQQRRAFVG